MTNLLLPLGFGLDSKLSGLPENDLCNLFASTALNSDSLTLDSDWGGGELQSILAESRGSPAVMFEYL